MKLHTYQEIMGIDQFNEILSSGLKHLLVYIGSRSQHAVITEHGTRFDDCFELEFYDLLDMCVDSNKVDTDALSSRYALGEYSLENTKQLVEVIWGEHIVLHHSSLSSETIDCYTKWFQVACEPNESHINHFENISLCIQDDIEQKIIIKDGPEHQELRNLYIKYKSIKKNLQP